MSIELKGTCPGCNYTNKFPVSWINPSRFTKPSEASVEKGIWCRNCESLIAFNVSLCGEEGQESAKVESSSFKKPSEKLAASSYSHNGSSDLINDEEEGELDSFLSLDNI